MTALNSNEWLDNKIQDDDINYFEYSEFSNVKKIGLGGFGVVNKADWESGETEVALKILLNNSSINESSMKEFLKELKNLRKVGFHPNINQFFGITKEPSSSDYIMVLQYANQGNLREYLKVKFKFLKWDDKVRMALDIARGLKWLHSRKIIHRDLHSKNILVHDDKLMIADLGLSKQLTADATVSSRIYGMPAYVEPQCHKQENYVRNEKSDIYSLGVLLWEITSGNPPFHQSQNTMIYKIANGLREQPITGTPADYINIYQKCWDDDPNLRPTTDEVFQTLRNISTVPTTNTTNTTPIEDPNKLDTDSNETQSQSDIGISPSLLQSESFEIGTSMTFSLSSSITSYQDEMISEADRKELSNISDEIILACLKENNTGWIKYFNFDRILEKYMPTSRLIFIYLNENTNLQYSEVIIGDFYYKGFGTDKNIDEAFKWYWKASQNDNMIGHFKVGYCYSIGHGTKKSDEEAFKFYQRAANKGLNIALYSLARFYESGIGTQKDSVKTFELYKKSAENGFIPSQRELASCYKLRDNQEDKKNALDWFKFYQENDGDIDVSSEIKDIEENLAIIT